MTLSALAFAVLAGIILLGAYKVVASPVITHSALFLALVLVSVAGIFLLLDAVFLAVVQVLVYAGAVMAVVIFAIMLSEPRELGSDGSGRGARFLQELRSALRSRYWGILPATVAGLLIALVAVVVARLGSPAPAAGVEVTVADIGRTLLTDYLVPFEIASAVLLVAVIGAVILTRGAQDGGRS